MKHIVSFFILLIIASSAYAQTGMPQGGMPPGTHPGHPPMETTTPVLKASYPDSVAFNAAFKALYPLIRTTPNIKERAESMVNHMGRTFQTRGLDSAKVLDSVMNAIDQYKDEKLLFAAYRAQFSAEDLKSMILFFKTPAGKHYLEIESQLFNARNGEIDRYVNNMVRQVLSRMNKPVETAPGAPHTGMGQPGMGKPGMQPPPIQPPPPPAPTKD